MLVLGDSDGDSAVSEAATQGLSGVTLRFHCSWACKVQPLRILPNFITLRLGKVAHNNHSSALLQLLLYSTQQSISNRPIFFFTLYMS